MNECVSLAWPIRNQDIITCSWFSESWSPISQSGQEYLISCNDLVMSWFSESWSPISQSGQEYLLSCNDLFWSWFSESWSPFSQSGQEYLLSCYDLFWSWFSESWSPISQSGQEYLLSCNDLFWSWFSESWSPFSQTGLDQEEFVYMSLFQCCCHFAWRNLFILGFRSVYGILNFSGVRSKANLTAESVFFISSHSNVASGYNFIFRRVCSTV